MEKETKRQLRLGFKFERKPSQLKLGLNMKESPIPYLHTFTPIDTNIKQLEMFQDIDKGTFTYFLGFSPLQQGRKDTILREMTGIGEGNIENQPENKTEANQDEQIQPSESSFPASSRRSFLDKDITRRDLFIAGGLLAFAGILKSIKTGNIPFANEVGNLFNSSEKSSENNPFHIGEGQPKDGTLVLSKQEYLFREEMTGYMNYVPDGPITYWTTKDGKRRYLLTGGDMNPEKGWIGNATYMIETDGKQSLKDIMSSGKVTADSFTEAFTPNRPENEDDEGEWYAGITSVLQNPKNADDLWGTVHKEIRSNRNQSDGFQAEVLFVKSSDGGKTWKRMDFSIKGTDVKPAGFVVGTKENGDPLYRVTGAGEPTSIYNPVDGYAYFAWVDWKASEGKSDEDKAPDEIFMGRAKMGENWEMGQIEYWTTDGYSTQMNKDTLKSIIPVPSEQFVYTALPKLSWDTELNKWHCAGECNTGFWQSWSTNLTDWTKPELVYDFSSPITVQRRDFTEPGQTPGPVISEVVTSKPHNILPKGEKWDSYPTFLSENYPNSTLIGKTGTFYHSTGDNYVPHVPAVVDFEIH